MSEGGGGEGWGRVGGGYRRVDTGWLGRRVEEGVGRRVGVFS